VAENKPIKNFTAADIEKYWNKKLSSAEMHEIEKAAMDDPFLAEALEGYQYSTKHGEEVGILRERFEKKLNDSAPVIPFYRKKYKWLRVAAAVVVLVGASLLVQQLVFKANKEDGPVVNVNKPLDKSNNGADAIAIVPQKTPDTANNKPVTTETATVKTEKLNVSVADQNTSYAFTPVDSSKLSNVEANTIKERKYDTLSVINGIVNTSPEKKEIADAKAKAADDIAAVARTNNRKDGEIAERKWASNNANQAGLLNNSFNYRVVDAQNNPVPFANVLNTRDNIGTYTDVRGYFNLVSSDSILDVQVRSLGYNSENYKLIPSRQANSLILKEDATARNNLYDNNRSRVMSQATRRDSADVVEPEVGWGNYNTYVENNIKIPENVGAKNALKDVELSFDVDKSGTPINIKVTKSSQCKECDEEAKRLLKEGPKWKKKGKKSKTTISISVDQK
jgi:TonB family protein